MGCSLPEFRLRNDVPYGVWTCPDGREVLFNRWYEPLWQRGPGDVPPTAADPREWVEFQRQTWFYNGEIRTDLAKIAAGVAALTSWGLAAPDWFHKRARANYHLPTP